MKKTSFAAVRGWFLAGFALAWALTGPDSVSAVGKQSASPAPGTVPAGRLVILRSASLGPTIVGLKVDGKQTAQITYNRRYEGPLTAGEHVLTVYPVISYQGARPTQKRVKVEPGKTYTFRAVREDIQLVLK